MPNGLRCRAAMSLVAMLALGACQDVSAPADSRQEAQLGPLPNLTCQGVVGGRVVGTVEVKRGDSCVLTDVTVRGNVKVLEGAILEVAGGTVEGNVEGDKAFAVEVRGTRVDGNVQVQGSEFAVIIDATVGGSIQVKQMLNPGDGVVLVTGNMLLAGNIQIEDNHVLTLDVSENAVKGNVQVVKNVGSGLKLVAGNRVLQNLQCGANSPPFTAADNLAGNREGQCQ